MVLVDKLGRKYLVRWFPCVIRLGVSFPFDQILKSPCSPEITVTPDLFNFEFHFSFHDVRRGPREVDSMLDRFAIRGQQGRMEDVVDGPGRREGELIGDR